MYHDRNFEIQHETINKVDRFIRLFRSKTRKSSWLIGTSPLALAACGGGGSDDQAATIIRTLVAGTDGADVFENTSSNDRIEGGLGDDIFVVDFGGGNDLITDTGGNDTLKIVFRDAENNAQLDTMYKDGANLVVEMRDGQTTTTVEDAFKGDTAIETINAFHAGGNWGEGILGNLYLLDDENIESGDHVAVGTNSADTYDSTADGKNGLAIFAAGGDDTITTGDGIQYIFGGAGDDILNGGEGDDTVLGEAGDDTIYMSPGVDVEDGGDGTDTLILGDWAGSYSGTLNLTNGDNFAAGGDGSTSNHKIYNFENVKTETTGDMIIIGTDGDNVIETGSGVDIIRAGDGDDIIFSGGGNDEVYGGPGDDIIYATDGGDFEDGGEGTDTMVILGNNAPADFIINLETETGAIPGGRTFENTFANFENLKIGYEWSTGSYVGSNTNWEIIGTNGDNVLETSEGNDVLDNGGGGNDTLIGNGGNDEYVIQGWGTDTVNIYDNGGELDVFSIVDNPAGTDNAALLVNDNNDLIRVTNSGHTDIIHNDNGELAVEVYKWVGDTSKGSLSDYSADFTIVTKQEDLVNQDQVFVGTDGDDVVELPDDVAGSRNSWSEIYLNKGDDTVTLSESGAMFFIYTGEGNDKIIVDKLPSLSQQRISVDSESDVVVFSAASVNASGTDSTAVTVDEFTGGNEIIVDTQENILAANVGESLNGTGVLAYAVDSFALFYDADGDFSDGAIHIANLNFVAGGSSDPLSGANFEIIA